MTDRKEHVEPATGTRTACAAMDIAHTGQILQARMIIAITGRRKENVDHEKENHSSYRNSNTFNHRMQ